MNFKNSYTGANYYDQNRMGYSSVSKNYNFSQKSKPHFI